ncbi:hypothetical protein E4T80_10685 [Muribacter muris]|uniref:Uncharacterized protein n=1 Tax=Muribacter muris TaxID=67855 RepID=A0A4Y9JR54_9PAST|nr:hypothetical protein [Muribacter muris]MBF0785934.1 hypothetical protein [Muribacter muris]MBF0827690.1 hypothetical protein [Muribacter muris]TFV08284.1 hypothetical protein E4T80_10685 [Muribacter muris]
MLTLEDFKNLIFDREELEEILGFSLLPNDKKLQLENRIKSKNTDEIDTSQQRITELEQQLLQEQAKNAELLAQLECLKNVELQSSENNYNPTEKETHLQIIYGLVEILTNRTINHQKYLRGNGINKAAIANGLEAELKGLFTNPRTVEGFRNKLTEILNRAA